MILLKSLEKGFKMFDTKIFSVLIGALVLGLVAMFICLFLLTAPNKRNVEEFPVGQIVNHKLSTATGVVVGHSEDRVYVRFINEYAGIQQEVRCLPIELTKTKKNIMDKEVTNE